MLSIGLNRESMLKNINFLYLVNIKSSEDPYIFRLLFLSLMKSTISVPFTVGFDL